MQPKTRLGILLVCLLTILSVSACSAKVIYVKTTGSDLNNGLSWATPKKSVKGALDSVYTYAGDEIWVAAGIYHERLTLRESRSLYGGFAGTETSRSQRDCIANVTILDGDGAGHVIYSTDFYVRQSTVIDGFTITNGGASSGGGIYLYSASPTISNNNIVGNGTSAGDGGAIFCEFSTAIIAGNRIAANNSFYGYGGAIYCAGFGPTIVNNTIVGNVSYAGGGAIFVDPDSSPTIANNIIAFNSSGIRKSSGTGTPVLSHNCVYGNTTYNYTGLSAGDGDISADPLLADRGYGDYHVQPGSPCRNAGTSSVSGLPETDIDGQARILEDAVDIGADESNGSTSPAGPYAIIHVTASGNDSNDGSSWASAKRTVQAGIIAASAVGGDVWVATGTYSERIVLYPRAYLYGGFAGTETDRVQRNRDSNPTILDGGKSGPVILAKFGIQMSGIDGFTITNGTNVVGAGIYCNGASPTIENNIITGNTATSTTTGGGAIYCHHASPTIANNTITNNSASTCGGGIYCYYNAPNITNNTITGNHAQHGAGVYCSIYEPDPKVVIRDNTILGNTASVSGGGIRYLTNTYDADSAIANNLIQGNSAPTGGGIYSNGRLTIAANLVKENTSSTSGGGIYCDGLSGSVINNIVVKNTASTSGGGIFISTGQPLIRNNTVVANTSPTGAGMYGYTDYPIANNIFAFNFGDGLYVPGTSSARLNNNCAYGNTTANYAGQASPGVGDTFVDPGFVDPEGEDYHLQIGSPCIDAGDDTLTISPWPDFEGESRPYGAHADIGADEWDGTQRTVGPTFTPGGGSYTSAQNVQITCPTPDVVIHYTTNGQVPTESDPVVSGTLYVDRDMVLKAKAWKTGWTPSCVKTDTFLFSTGALALNPTPGRVGSPLNVLITCPTPDAVIHYTTNGADPTENDPVTAGSVFVDRNLLLKAIACRPGWPSSPIATAGYEIVPFSDAKRSATSSTVTLYAAVVAAVMATNQVYVETDDRSCGMLVIKSAHGLTVGQRVDVQGTLAVGGNGEKCLNATSITPRGTGSIAPLAITNHSLGGGSWFYNASTGEGQKGVKDYRLVETGGGVSGTFVDAAGMNNIGLLVTTFGRVTYSTTSYFYIDDGSAMKDNSAYSGVKVLGSVPKPDPLPPGWTPVGHYVMVTGISTCFKAPSPSTDLYRQVRATAVQVLD